MEPTVPQHDETIVPLRPLLRASEAAAAVAPPAPPARRGSARAAMTALGVVASLAAVVAVFVWLPARVAEQQQRVDSAAAAPPAAPAASAVPELSPEEVAALKVRAEDLLAGLLTLQGDLGKINVKDWAGADWERYRQLSETGDNAFLANDYAAAVASYGEATSLAHELIARAGAIIEGSFDAGNAALAAGDAALALEQYTRVLTVEPTHAGALAGRARAERLPEVLALVQRAGLETSRGEHEAALATYRAALALDAQWQPASAGVAAVSRVLRDAEFERLLSAGYAALTAEDFAAARSEFEAALALKPGAREAQDGLVQAEDGVKLDRIELTEARALAFERRELWDQAIALYRATLATDETLVFAQTGLARAEARAGLDAKLRNLIDNPTLLFGDAVLAEAGKLLETAAAEPEQGPRLTAQIADLRRLVEAASAPLTVRLESDQLTSITLYRVGALGAFAARDVELRPGTYTVIGSRNGYRDVRQTFTVRPGRNLPPVRVVCVEPI